MSYRNSICSALSISEPNKHIKAQWGALSLISDSINYKTLIGLGMIFLLASPFARSILEISMLTHVLVQLPLLTLCGIWIAINIKKHKISSIPYHYSLPLLIVALITSMFWMIPRVLDASLEHTTFTVLKFISLPFLLGVPLALGWKNIGSITKAFVITNILSMLIVLAWLYIEAPMRLCNYYLIDEQKQLGVYLLYISGFISLLWSTKLFIGNANDNYKK